MPQSAQGVALAKRAWKNGGMSRPRLSYANVVATLALFLALGGTTIAATKIDGKHIKPGSLPGKALKRATVTGAKVKPDSLTGKQVKEAKLGQVPSADRADEAGHAADADRVGGLTAAQLRDACPTGTTLYAGVCIETEVRGISAMWPVAARFCGDAGRRLPSLAELEGFRHLPGIDLYATGEHVDEVVDHDGLGNSTIHTLTLRDSGTISTGVAYGGSYAHFRCVAQPTNR